MNKQKINKIVDSFGLLFITAAVFFYIVFVILTENL